MNKAMKDQTIILGYKAIKAYGGCYTRYKKPLEEWWSFKLYENGVVLLAEQSQFFGRIDYELTVPQEIVNELTVYLKQHQEITESLLLPNFGYGCTQAVFTFLGKSIKALSEFNGYYDVSTKLEYQALLKASQLLQRYGLLAQYVDVEVKGYSAKYTEKYFYCRWHVPLRVYLKLFGLKLGNKLWTATKNSLTNAVSVLRPPAPIKQPVKKIFGYEGGHGFWETRSWSFAVYSNGIVVLKTMADTIVDSSYSFIIPQRKALRICNYFNNHKELIDALPYRTGSGCDGGSETFYFLNKEVYYIMREENASSNSSASTVLEKAFEYIIGIIAHFLQTCGFSLGNADEVISLLSAGAESCLKPYGLSVKNGWQWNIPNYFYSSAEREPIIEYYNAASAGSAETADGRGVSFFAVYDHGSVVLKDGYYFYQFKVLQRTADRVKRCLESHKRLFYMFPYDNDTEQYHARMAVEITDNGIRCNEMSGGESTPAISKLLIKACRFLKPYGLFVQVKDKRIWCEWQKPNYIKDSILIGFQDDRHAFTIHECGTVHVREKYDSILYSDCLYVHAKEAKAETVQSCFSLPPDSVNRLRERIIKHQDTIDIIAANIESCSGHDRVYNFRGTEITINNSDFSDKLLKDYRRRLDWLLLETCKILKQYGFSANAAKYEDCSYRFFWSIRGVPNHFFIPSGHPSACS